MQYLEIFFSVVAVGVGLLAVLVIGAVLLIVAGSIVEYWPSGRKAVPATFAVGDHSESCEGMAGVFCKKCMVADGVKVDSFPVELARGRCPDCDYEIAKSYKGNVVLSDKLWCVHCQKRVWPVWAAVGVPIKPGDVPVEKFEIVVEVTDEAIAAGIGDCGMAGGDHD